MPNNIEIIQLAKDMITGRCPAQFDDSKKNSDALRDMFIKANGGSAELSIKTFRPGYAAFDITQELIPVIVHEGFTGDEFWMQLCDYRNIALGDQLEFISEDQSTLIVSDLSYGTSGIRRQRLGEGQRYTIETRLKGIKVYDELKRFMAGRVDFDKFVRAVAKAMQQRLYEDIYNALLGVTTSTRGLSSTYVYSGTFAEDKALDIAEHVSAANNGAKVIIVGTKKALRKLTMAVTSDQAKDDLYSTGYYGKFYGFDCIFMNQRHKAGTEEFLYKDDRLYFIAVGMDKPIKVVNVGEGLLWDDRNAGRPLTADLTTNYTYAQEFGVALAFNAKMGFYTISA